MCIPDEVICKYQNYFIQSNALYKFALRWTKTKNTECLDHQKYNKQDYETVKVSNVRIRLFLEKKGIKERFCY